MVGAVPPVITVAPGQLAPTVPSVTEVRKVTVVEPLTQPSVAATVTTPPALALGVRTPAPLIAPAGVSSVRLTDQVSEDAGMEAVWLSLKVPVAVNGMVAGVVPLRVTVESA